MKLNTKHFQCMQMLYSNHTREQIIKALDITSRTLDKWQEDIDFKRGLVELATQQIGDLVPEAVKTLGTIIKDDYSKASDRIQASKLILEYARVNDRADLEANVNIKIEYV